MDSLVFHIDADKADAKMLESIKAFFGNRRVQVSVQPEEDVYTLDELAQKVERNRDSAVSYTFNGGEFDETVTKLLNDEPVNLDAYKQTDGR